MSVYAQIRRGRVRLIKEYDVQPAYGEWVDITNADPVPNVGDTWDGTSFAAYVPPVKSSVMVSSVTSMTPADRNNVLLAIAKKLNIAVEQS